MKHINLVAKPFGCTYNLSLTVSQIQCAAIALYNNFIKYFTRPFKEDAYICGYGAFALYQ